MVLAIALCGCHQQSPTVSASGAAVKTGLSVGFDRNEYPGDTTMDGLRKDFNFAGYWLTPPPGETENSWVGKRPYLRQQGWGFLVLANGKVDAEILAAQRAGTNPGDLGRKDAAAAVASAKSEGFPAQTILFLDQEEGGALLTEQADYLLGWTEAVSATGYRAGIYASGQPVPAGGGKTIDTIRDVRARVQQGHLHPVAAFGYQDACPPAPGCTLKPKPLSDSGSMDLSVWQYAQSPRRPEITKSCAKTYATDDNCYAPGFPDIFVDLDAANSTDPSNGR
jgi:hypothetical protein